jgi:hypothetical protein
VHDSVIAGVWVSLAGLHVRPRRSSAKPAEGTQDKAKRPVLAKALIDGKELSMAVPRHPSDAGNSPLPSRCAARWPDR